MSNNLSARHHFIPKFYLENFTDSVGSFYIYLVKEKRFKGGGKKFTPKSHFFQTDGNTVHFHPHLPDYLETKQYSSLDTDISPIIRKIRDSENLRYDLSQLEMVQVNYFISHLYWRNPSQDEEAKKLLKEKSLSELGFIFKGNSEYVEQAEKIFRANPDFFKIVKWMLPLGLHYLCLELEAKMDIVSFGTLNGGSLLGDNPVVFTENKNINSYTEEMVVPLTSETFYIRSKNGNVYFDERLKAIYDVLQLQQATEYVCVTDKAYIDKLEYLKAKFAMPYVQLKKILFYEINKNNT